MVVDGDGVSRDVVADERVVVALDRLAREFAAVEKIDQDVAEQRIETFLLRAA